VVEWLKQKFDYLAAGITRKTAVGKNRLNVDVLFPGTPKYGKNNNKNTQFWFDDYIVTETSAISV